LGLFCAGLRMIKARIGSGALRWRSFCYFDEWSLRGKLPFIGSLKCRPELQWRWWWRGVAREGRHNKQATGERDSWRTCRSCGEKRSIWSAHQWLSFSCPL